ncbi:RHS repeat-associated core domain-containing protein [Sorangium sp. So ce302]|uniref:RHS repeat-associated core domain-containing protein n=1 Tax=Sorangium sp. So ce302 TaxID=3133297 RepID=UPI003F5FCD5F
MDERIYLGGYEVYRRRNSSGLVLERQTLHVMDGARRVAMVETKTVDTSGPFTVTPRVRYQLDNHLGSASLEVDGAGLVIGYEEYHPYGTTAYWSASSAAEVSRKRYRYTGKEKDEETGLYYHGARYYAPWLGRWTSADPAGMVDGPNLYTYVSGNPIVLRDPTGMWDERVVPAPAPGVKKPDAPPPPGKDFAAQKAAEAARQATAQAERLGAELGGKFGKAIGEADEALKTLDSLTAGALPRILKSNPKFVEELQTGLAEKLNAIPELPTFTDPKLAEAAQRGFERGFGGGLDEARARAAAVNVAAGTALALAPGAAAAIERAGTAALRGALARLRDMPIFLPGAAGGAGGFLRVPKPQIAEAARGAPAITKGSQVTEQTIREAMKGAPLSSQQSGGVSLPTIQRYVDKLLAGEVAPAIKVDGQMIVDGNHRYIAGRILGREPAIQPWAGGRPSSAVPWETIPIDPKAWP